MNEKKYLKGVKNAPHYRSKTEVTNVNSKIHFPKYIGFFWTELL